MPTSLDRVEERIREAVDSVRASGIQVTHGQGWGVRYDLNKERWHVHGQAVCLLGAFVLHRQPTPMRAALGNYDIVRVLARTLQIPTEEVWSIVRGFEWSTVLADKVSKGRRQHRLVDWARRERHRLARSAR